MSAAWSAGCSKRSPVDSPLPFRFTRGLAAFLGRSRVSSFAEFIHRSQLMGGRLRRRQQSIFARILKHEGQAPNPATLERLTRELAAVYTDHMITLQLLDPRKPKADGIELPLRELADIRAGGHGALLVSPHFGNAALALAGLGLEAGPLTVLFVEAAGYQWLRPFGIQAVGLGDGASALTRALSDGQLVWLNCDIDFFPEDRLSPLFGAPVRPPHAAARLAAATGVPIIPAYPTRDTAGWKLELDEAIWPEGQTQEALEWEILRSMERAIGQRPAHWWVFRDLWDIKATDAENRKLLGTVDRARALRSRFSGR